MPFKGNAEIIEKVVAQLRDMTGEERSRAETFIRAYYRQVDPADLGERSVSNLRGAALAHLNLINGFETGAARVRVARRPGPASAASRAARQAYRRSTR